MTVEAITKDTEIIDFKKTDIPIEDLSKITNINQDILDNWNKLTQIDGKWYFFKSEDYQQMLMNELIGESLATKMQLDTVHYKIAREERMYPVALENIGDTPYNYGLISENYRKPDVEYINSLKLDVRTSKTCLVALNDIVKYCRDMKNYNELIKKIIKLIVLDFYMQQTDRNGYNLYFSKDENGYFDLCPILDYEYSFWYSKNYYSNSLVGVCLDYKETVEEIRRNQFFQEEFNRIMNININEVITEIIEKFNLNIGKGYLNIYTDNDLFFKSLVKKYKIIK